MTLQRDLIDQFRLTRKMTEKIVSPLLPEDFVIQSADFVSPPKWHLAHTTWFFENFILREFLPDYQVRNESYLELFNSYYKSQGEPWARDKRGHLSRPTTNEILDYRTQVDELILGLFLKIESANAWKRLELGIHHEQQHQELLLMDMKHILSRGVNPVSYREHKKDVPSEKPTKLQFTSYQSGLIDVGAETHSESFSFDNETPRHKFYLHEFSLANRPVTNGDYLEFIQDGGYKNPLLWKSDGWEMIQNSPRHPLYWRLRDNVWHEYTLEGEESLNLAQPVSHLSFYEADAFATWAQARLPTEFELEYVYNQTNENAYHGFLESGTLRPCLYLEPDSPYMSLQGNLWEWTSSSYTSYPKYKKPPGAFGEYNQKFMSNQMVLRGGSYGTPRSHYRKTYRNFFYPHQKWAFTGLRLAKDV